MTETSSPSSPPPALALLQMITGRWVAQAIHAAAALGVADALRSGPRRADEIAGEVGAHGPAVYRLLRALASVGLFVEDGDGRFAATAMGDLLRSDVPGSLRAFATMAGNPGVHAAWGSLLHSVRTGEPAFDHVHHMPVFEYYTRQADEGETFSRAMSSFTAAQTAPILAAYDFSGFRRVVDVGGAHGDLLAAIVAGNPGVTGVLFDLPQVVEQARARFAAAGVAERVELRGGDFFAGPLPPADALVLKHVLHDWGDADAARILAVCHAAVERGGKLLVIEQVVPPGNAPFFGKILDIEMLVMGGQERSEHEYVRLLTAAGFAQVRVIATAAPISILEATRA